MKVVQVSRSIFADKRGLHLYGGFTKEYFVHAKGDHTERYKIDIKLIPYCQVILHEAVTVGLLIGAIQVAKALLGF